MKGEIPGNFALYFMMTFILVKIFVAIIDVRKFAIYLMPIFFAVAFVLNRLDWGMPIYCENIFLGLFYFCLGYVYENTKSQSVRLANKDLSAKDVWLIFATLIMIGYAFKPSWVEFPGNTVVYGNYVIGFFGAGAAIILFNQLFSRIGHIPFLEWIGRNSLIILGMHLNILLIGQIVFSMKIILAPYMQCLLMLSMVLAIMPIVIMILTQSKLTFLGFSHD